MTQLHVLFRMVHVCSWQVLHLDDRPSPCLFALFSCEYSTLTFTSDLKLAKPSWADINPFTGGADRIIGSAISLNVIAQIHVSDLWMPNSYGSFANRTICSCVNPMSRHQVTKMKACIITITTTQTTLTILHRIKSIAHMESIKAQPEDEIR